MRPFLVFVYRYFIRLGFLDSYAGLIFCLLQGFWYNLIIDARLSEVALGYDSFLPIYGGHKQHPTTRPDTSGPQKMTLPQK